MESEMGPRTELAVDGIYVYTFVDISGKFGITLEDGDEKLSVRSRR